MRLDGYSLAVFGIVGTVTNVAKAQIDDTDDLDYSSMLGMPSPEILAQLMALSNANSSKPSRKKGKKERQKKEKANHNNNSGTNHVYNNNFIIRRKRVFIWFRSNSE